MDAAAALETLRHGEEHARRRVVAELAGSERREAIAALLVAVGDESWAVRQAAVEALARLSPDALLPTLEAALRDGDDAGSSVGSSASGDSRASASTAAWRTAQLSSPTATSSGAIASRPSEPASSATTRRRACSSP